MDVVERRPIVSVEALTAAVVSEDEVLMDVGRHGLEGIFAGDVGQKRQTIPTSKTANDHGPIRCRSKTIPIVFGITIMIPIMMTIDKDMTLSIVNY